MTQPDNIQNWNSGTQTIDFKVYCLGLALDIGISGWTNDQSKAMFDIQGFVKEKLYLTI